jgi:pimeloyl-ACP methyl ester carboxylesterase
MVIGLEHRYYGQGNNSKPVPDFSTPNMKWLSVDQALADTANFIKNVKIPELETDAKWIAVGGSYAGNLAAWMRLKYPDLVYAAHSSSAPVIAQLDFPRYGHAVIKGIPKVPGGSQVCADNWVKVVTYFDELVTSTNATYVLDLLNLKDQTIGDVASWTWAFASAVQYGYSDTPVERLCGGIEFPLMVDPEASSAELFHEHITFIYSLFKDDSSAPVESGLDVFPWYWQVIFY